MNFNIKRIIAILLVLTIVGFGVGIVILITNPGSVVLGQRGISLSNMGNSHTKTASLEIDNQIQIIINNSVGDLFVELYDGDKIEVVYKAFERSVLEINESSQSIKIEGKITPRGSINNINTSINPVSLKVMLPRNYNQRLDIQNGVGKSVLKIGDYSDFNAKTGVGDMDLIPQKIIGGSFVAEVGVGSLKITLPKEADVSLTANAGLGNVSNRFKFDSEESSNKFVSQSFSGTIGQGTGTVTLKVGTGDISIR